MLVAHTETVAFDFYTEILDWEIPVDEITLRNTVSREAIRETGAPSNAFTEVTLDGPNVCVEVGWFEEV
jgi:hypothetical protein